MHFKNIQIILAFIIFALLVLSTPIQNNEQSILESNNSDSEEDVILLSNNENDSSSEVEVETLPADVQEDINEDIIPTDKSIELDHQFSIISFSGDDGLDAFLAHGGNSTDSGLIDFMTNYHHLDYEIEFSGVQFGCSSFSVPKKDGQGYYFGRNLDDVYTDSLIIVSHPSNGDYSSISTSNIGHYRRKDGKPFTDDGLRIIGLYGGLDGLNEKGLTVSVNVIPPLEEANQETPKADITIPVAVRLLLNKASNVQEAIDLLKNYDMHAMLGQVTVHIAITDNSGKAVVVEYVNKEVNVVESAINENFYLSKEVDDTQVYPVEYRVRYQIIQKALEENPTMDFNEVKQTLMSTSQNVPEAFTDTEWTVIYDKNDIEATYYHRLNYNHGYHIKL